MVCVVVLRQETEAINSVGEAKWRRASERASERGNRRGRRTRLRVQQAIETREPARRSICMRVRSGEREWRKKLN